MKKSQLESLIREVLQDFYNSKGNTPVDWEKRDWKLYDENYVLQDLEDKFDIDLDLHDDGKSLTLSRIVIPKDKRGQGVGSKVMNLITQYADAQNKSIYLTPSKDFGATSTGRLEQFYKQFGFKKKDRSDFSTKETMVREPQTSENFADEKVKDEIRRYIDDYTEIEVDILKKLLKYKKKYPKQLDPRTGGNKYGYRGTTFDIELIKKLKVINKSNGVTEYQVPSGLKITSKGNKGFLSFSTDEEVAQGFGDYSGHFASLDKEGVGGYVRVSLDNPNFILHPDFMGELSKELEYSKESEKETLFIGNTFEPDRIYVLDKYLYNENFSDGKVDEAKQIGNLYHYTSADGLKGILQSNTLKASEEEYLGNELYYTSFTRNKNFHKKGQTFNVRTDYRITLDGDKLSNKYKIKPFAYKPGWNYADNWEYDWLEDEPESVVRDFFNTTGDYDEQEERIFFKGENGSIPNIKDYILKVDKVSDLKENYADGKVKGKSRPGRVKKAGASCKGSVTDLRAKAKKYGGEKGKMYHWCANMKSGKK